MTPDLDRLRRFAIGAAVVLILYSLAGVELDQNAKATVFGIPFVIRRPDLLPAGLMLVCVYALVRFYYYGMMLTNSPQQRRKDILHQSHGKGVEKAEGTYDGSVFFGPAVYNLANLEGSYADAKAVTQRVLEAFPKVWRNRPSGTVERVDLTQDDGSNIEAYEVTVTIPFPCRLAALIQDVDYTAPIWLNLIALTLAALAFFGVQVAIR